MHRQSLFTEASRVELAAADAENALKAPFDALAGDLVDRMLYADSKVRLPDHPVMISDRMSMAHGLEARSPFMDHKLAEYAAHLPWTLKVRGRHLRYIQRKLAARYLPPEILRARSRVSPRRCRTSSRTSTGISIRPTCRIPNWCGRVCWRERPSNSCCRST